MIERFVSYGRLLFFALTPLLPVIQAAPQAANTPPPAFCANDPDDAVRQFCPLLGQLLDGAQKGKTKSPADLRNDLQPILDQVSPLDQRTEQTFVFAVANGFAAQAASTSLIQAANQLRTDQQLGPGSTAAGTTSLVSK